MTAISASAQPPPKKPDVIYKATPQVVVDRMLEMGRVSKEDVVYDLGCGDGRMVVTAARRYGARGVGVDIDPKWVARSKENAREAGVASLVTIRQEDLFTTDLSEATVVTMYLLPNLNTRLLPKLAKLPPGSRVVCHSFPLREVRPAKVEKVTLPEGGYRTIYLYTIPWELEH